MQDNNIILPPYVQLISFTDKFKNAADVWCDWF